VELGPAKVLAGMAKRTRDTKFAVKDMSMSIDRQFLASTQDFKDLQYEYDPPGPQPEDSEEDTSEPGPTIVEAPPVVANTAPPKMSPQAAAVTATSVAEVPTSALEIVCALVAQKLKRDIEQLQASSSIKELTGGESAISQASSYRRSSKLTRESRKIHVTK
jgi:fatty acid synthase subunit alpha, fungi type